MRGGPSGRRRVMICLTLVRRKIGRKPVFRQTLPSFEQRRHPRERASLGGPSRKSRTGGDPTVASAVI